MIVQLASLIEIWWPRNQLQLARGTNTEIQSEPCQGCLYLATFQTESGKIWTLHDKLIMSNYRSQSLELSDLPQIFLQWLPKFECQQLSCCQLNRTTCI